MIDDLVILNNLFFEQNVYFFFSNMAINGGADQLAWKRLTPFCKILMFKKKYFVVFCLIKVVLRRFNIFPLFMVKDYVNIPKY